jgi:hypothetical protein
MGWLIVIGIAVMAVVRVIGSPVIEPPPYRILFFLLVIGLVLISVLPEATFILPAVNAVGLDIVTILVALELSRYLICVSRTLAIPTFVAVYRRGPAQVVSRCQDVMRTNPVLWLYACSWVLISVRAFLGKDWPRA